MHFSPLHLMNKKTHLRFYAMPSYSEFFNFPQETGLDFQCFNFLSQLKTR